MTPARAGMLRCALAAGLFGASTPLASRLADETGAPVLAGLLYLGAGAAVLPFAVCQRPSHTWRQGLGRLSVAVAAGGFLGPLLLAAGLARTSPASVSLLLNLELVATLLLAGLVFGEHLGSRVLLGGGLVVAAGGLLAWSGSSDVRIGALLVVGACLCWGLDNCVTAELVGISPQQVTVAKGLIAGTTNLVVGLSIGSDLPPAGTVLAALVIGAVGYGASTTLWVAGARSLGAARGQLVFSSAPFVGVLVAWAVLGDDVRLVEVIALALAAVGVLSTIESGHEHPHAHEPVAHAHEHRHDDGHHDHDHPGQRVEADRHGHDHAHAPTTHAHPHVPDLHHRHG